MSMANRRRGKWGISNTSPTANIRQRQIVYQFDPFRRLLSHAANRRCFFRKTIPTLTFRIYYNSFRSSRRVSVPWNNFFSRPSLLFVQTPLPAPPRFHFHFNEFRRSAISVGSTEATTFYRIVVAITAQLNFYGTTTKKRCADATTFIIHGNRIISHLAGKKRKRKNWQSNKKMSFDETPTQRYHESDNFISIHILNVLRLGFLSFLRIPWIINWHSSSVRKDVSSYGRLETNCQALVERTSQTS